MENLEVLVKALLYGLVKELCRLGIHKDISLVSLFQLDMHLRDLGKVGHSAQSQHYAGVAFDVAQTLTNAKRTLLRNSAKNSGVWSYVEPASLTPTWVHFDKRSLSPACASRRVSTS